MLTRTRSSWFQCDEVRFGIVGQFISGGILCTLHTGVVFSSTSGGLTGETEQNGGFVGGDVL